MAYGDKRDYRKIEIHVQAGETELYRYVGTTTWSATCKDAKANFLRLNPHLKPSQVHASFK